ncbi:unnamed protein product [Didymodactylos carnosus]|uniref:Uncharacterized protein n=1 Tax=Didymodactylos carnosus TaxID=1234261 RepID=A0A815C5E2_9BILA|nr:unnamed protein product [Didymodactylos carnosus]CAF1377621.1 unnamed protein product [Didymodactylos carnosus]CAF4078823.1 unnamed protein product [Didymodactylos carnosus]CAF4186324.1 unnamed protein product [Didymodactylos carnosus]
MRKPIYSTAILRALLCYLFTMMLCIFINLRCQISHTIIADKTIIHLVNETDTTIKAISFNLFDFIKICSNSRTHTHNSTCTALILNEYVRFHAATLLGFGQPKFLLITPTTRVGLGNRLEQIEAAFFLAILSGRALLIDHRTPYPLSSLFDSRNLNIQWDYSESTIQMLQVAHEKSLKTQRLHVKQLSSLLINKSLDFYDHFNKRSSVHILHIYQPVMLDWPFELIHKLPKYKDVLPFLLGSWPNYLFSFLFSPTLSIKRRYEQFFRKAKLDLPQNTWPSFFPWKTDTHRKTNRRLIVVQLRVQGLSSTFRNHFQSTITRYIGCIQYFIQQMLEKALSSSITVLLVSDMTGETRIRTHKEINEKISEYCQNVRSRTECPVVLSPTMPTHSAINISADALIGVILDFWLMGSGDITLVSHRSSFGLLGTRRNLNPVFIMDSDNQCTHTNESHYLVNKYIDMMAFYEKHGYLRRTPLD